MRVFKNRTEAGRELAAPIEARIARPYVVAAIPRGGVAVALPIAERLAVPLTLSYARKLTSPRAPELAFGALDEDGQAIIEDATVAALALSGFDIEQARVRVAAEIERRIALYRVPPLARFLPGPGVVLVDDGLATGLTMRAAVAYARRHGAREVTVAVPCASAHAARRFREAADHFVSLVVDEEFTAVARYYADFPPVRDDEVATMLARAAEHVPNSGSDAFHSIGRRAEGPERRTHMSTEGFVRMVMTTAAIDDSVVAQRAIAAVFHALRDRLTPEESDQVMAQLPRPLKEVWSEGDVKGRHPVKLNRPEFFERVREVAALPSTTEARRVTLAVFAALKTQLTPGEGDDVWSQLPKDLKEVWAEARAA